MSTKEQSAGGWRWRMRKDLRRCWATQVLTPPKLTAAQLQMLPEFLWHGAEAYGFRGDVWTCPRIAQVIRWEFGVSYHKDHVSRLMKELGWTPQIPITRAVQRDEEAIERWRVEVWPELRRKAVRERRTLVFIDESGFYLVAREGQDLRTERENAGNRQVADPRSFVGDGRLHPSRQGVYSGSSGVVVEFAQRSVSRTSASSNGDKIVGHLGRLADPSMESCARMAGQRWSKAGSFGSVARLCS